MNYKITFHLFSSYRVVHIWGMDWLFGDVTNSSERQAALMRAASSQVGVSECSKHCGDGDDESGADGDDESGADGCAKAAAAS